MLVTCPTKYTPELVKKAREYIEIYKTEYDHEMPSHVGLSIVLKVNRSTLYDWATHEDKEISNILDECMAKQQLVLFNKGLTNDFNSAIVKLALGKHGYSDKIDQTNSGTLDITDMTSDKLDEKLLQMQQLLEQSTED